MYDKSIGLDTIWPRLLHIFGIENYLAALNDEELNEAYNIAKSKLEAKFHGNKKFPTWDTRCDALTRTLRRAMVDKDSLDDKDIESVYDTSTGYEKKLRLDSSVTSLMGLDEIKYRVSRDAEGHLLFDRTNEKVFNRIKNILNCTDSIDTNKLFSAWQCVGKSTEELIMLLKKLPVYNWNKGIFGVKVSDYGEAMSKGVLIQYQSDGDGKYVIGDFMDVPTEPDYAEGFREDNKGDTVIAITNLNDSSKLLLNMGLVGVSVESEDEYSYICIVGSLSIGGWLDANELYNNAKEMPSR